MQILGHSDDEVFTIVDRPKLSLRLVSLAVWSVSVFLFCKALVERTPSHAVLWGVLGMFALCSILLLRGFFFRPVRVRTIYRNARKVLEQSASWRTIKLPVTLMSNVLSGDSFGPCEIPAGRDCFQWSWSPVSDGPSVPSLWPSDGGGHCRSARSRTRTLQVKPNWHLGRFAEKKIPVPVAHTRRKFLYRGWIVTPLDRRVISRIRCAGRITALYLVTDRPVR
jgi:hypothetical protein